MVLKDIARWLYNFQTCEVKQKKLVGFFYFEVISLGLCNRKSQHISHNSQHFPHCWQQDPLLLGHIVRLVILKTHIEKGQSQFLCLLMRKGSHWEVLWDKASVFGENILKFNQIPDHAHSSQLSTEMIIPGVHQVRLWFGSECTCLDLVPSCPP